MTREELEELEPLVRKYLDSTYSVWVEDWLNRHGGLHTVLLALIAQARRAIELESKLDIAEANYRFMVERAADQKLDGYRELGQKAANAEQRADEAAATITRLRQERDHYRARALGLPEPDQD